MRLPRGGEQAFIERAQSREMTKWRGMGKRGFQPRYTVDQIIEAAIDVLDSVPPEKFTMRRLADHLDMGVMSLYGYVESKEQLLASVAAVMFAAVADNVTATATTDGSWQARLKAVAIGTHALVLRHPNLSTVLRGQNPPIASLFNVREQVLGILRQAGFDDERALRALGIVMTYAEGYATIQAARHSADLPNLPEGDFPILSANRRAYATHISTESYLHGLDLMIEGFERDLREKR